MSIHFAPAKGTNFAQPSAPIAKAMARRALKIAANDNDGGQSGAGAIGVGPVDTGRASAREGNDQMLRAALRHFAQHGLGAAQEARAQAEKAFFDGDRQAYDWWLGITRTLDRRLAAEAAKIAPDTATR